MDTDHHPASTQQGSNTCMSLTTSAEQRDDPNDKLVIFALDDNFCDPSMRSKFFKLAWERERAYVAEFIALNGKVCLIVALPHSKVAYEFQAEEVLQRACRRAGLPKRQLHFFSKPLDAPREDILEAARIAFADAAPFSTVPRFRSTYASVMGELPPNTLYGIAVSHPLRSARDCVPVARWELRESASWRFPAFTYAPSFFSQSRIVERARAVLEGAASAHASGPYAAGCTPPLVFAAMQGDIGMVEALLDCGANINLPRRWREVQDKGFYSKEWLWDGDSPLLAACRAGHYDVAQLLIDRGADITMGSCPSDDVFEGILKVIDRKLYVNRRDEQEAFRARVVAKLQRWASGALDPPYPFPPPPPRVPPPRRSTQPAAYKAPPSPLDTYSAADVDGLTADALRGILTTLSAPMPPMAAGSGLAARAHLARAAKEALSLPFPTAQLAVADLKKLLARFGVFAYASSSKAALRGALDAYLAAREQQRLAWRAQQEEGLQEQQQQQQPPVAGNDAAVGSKRPREEGAQPAEVGATGGAADAAAAGGAPSPSYRAPAPPTPPAVF